MRNILAILALFVCTSICLGGQQITINESLPYYQDLYNGRRSGILYATIAGNGNPKNFGHAYSRDYRGDATWGGDPSNNTLTIKDGAVLHNAYGAASTEITQMTNNKVYVTGGKFNSGMIAGARFDCYLEGVKANINGNIVDIKGGTGIEGVYGGYTSYYATVSSNTVTIENVIIGEAAGGRTSTGIVSSNTVTMENVTISSNVYGGDIVSGGTATANTVNLTSVTVTNDVYGARVVIGLASENAVIINGGRVGMDVYGGHINLSGTASSNTVTINGGNIGGHVYGGYVGCSGKAINNTINITGPTEFSTKTILHGGRCDKTATNDAFTGNTLNIETKGVIVNGISNFEHYKFCLKDIKPGDTVLTTRNGDYRYDPLKSCSIAYPVDLSRSYIHLDTKDVVIDKGASYKLIHSAPGFKDKGACKGCDSNERGLVNYIWNLTLTNPEDLVATLVDKKIKEEGGAKALSEGYGAGMACINQGMDCILSKIEETESVLGEREGDIGVFCGIAANKSKYGTGLHTDIDMSGISMMGGAGKAVEVGGKELTAGAFMEYGTGDSEILCEKEKKESKGTSKYVGGGLLGRYDLYENEFSGTKVYGVAVLRGGTVNNSFKGKDVKDKSDKEIEYDMKVMYGGAEVGGGCKYKVKEKIGMDWSLRYMFGYQGGKDGVSVDGDDNKVDFKSVISNRIRAGVRYIWLEKVKPYVGIGCEHEFSGKVKAAIKDGADMVGDIPAPSFGGWTSTGEVGARGKVWKFEVDISAQGYMGVRAGFGGTLKIKYAFGKEKTREKSMRQSKDEKK
jgi:hypothetical protein